MGKKTLKFLLATAIVGISVLPSMANSTDLTVMAEVSEIISLEIESVGSGLAVSVDDVDPSRVLPSGTNEVIDFGTVTSIGLDAGGIYNKAINTTNGTTGTALARMVDENDVYQTANGTILANNLGSVYYLDGRLRLRSVRTDGANMTVDLESLGVPGSELPVLVAADSVNNFSVGTTASTGNFITSTSGLQQDIANPGTGIANNATWPFDLAIHVSPSEVTGPKTMNLVFTGT